MDSFYNLYIMNFKITYLLKRSFLTFTLLSTITFYVPELLFSQTAAGGCNTVTVLTDPPYEQDLVIGAGWQDVPNDPCSKLVTPIPPLYATPRHWLEMKDNSGQWVTVQGGLYGIYGDVFNVTVHGTYRVRFQIPVKEITNSCPTGIACRSAADYKIWGYRGIWIPNSEYYFYSNEVVVGSTVQSDIVWNFIDPNNNGLFEPNQSIVMNTEGTKNYTAWWLAIFENGGENRYWSKGWTQGQVPSTINLRDEAGFYFNNFLQIPVSYTVQFAITAECNSSWTNLDRNFSICPGGWGCKPLNEKVSQKISMFPTLARSYFELISADAELDHVFLHNMYGNVVKEYGNTGTFRYEINDVPAGMYVVSVIKQNKIIFTGKLMVQ